METQREFGVDFGLRFVVVSQFGENSDQEPVSVKGPMCDGERINKNLGTSWDSAGGDLTWGAQTNKRTKKP